MKLWSAQFKFCSTAIQHLTPTLPTHPGEMVADGLLALVVKVFPFDYKWSMMSVACAENSHVMDLVSDSFNFEKVLIVAFTLVIL